MTGRRRVQFAYALFAIVAIGFAVRVAYVAAAKAGPCVIRFADGRARASSPSECAVGDQIYYNAQANSLARGEGFNEPLWRVTHPGEDPPPAGDHPPLTVLVLAPVSWLVEQPPLSWVIDEPLEDHVREHRYAMVVLGTLLVLLVGLLGRRVGGEPVGLGAAAIAALSPNIWVNDGLVMSETVTGLAVVAALLAAFALWDRPTLLRAGLLGGASGLAALARAEFVLLVALLVAVVACTTRAPWADRSAFAVAGVATALVVVGPWVAFNVARFEEFTTISTNDGIALAGSNCDPVYRGPHTGLTSIAGPRSCLDDPPPPGDQSQVARRYRERAFDYMGDHKGRVPAVMAARVGRTWGVFRPADMVWFNLGEGRERWVTRLGMVAYYPTLVAAVAGAVLLWRRSRPALWVLAVPAVVVTAGAALTYGQTRFRAAAEPSLAILAAVALARLPNLRHSATETVGE